jgi:hypothetical protein
VQHGHATESIDVGTDPGHGLFGDRFVRRNRHHAIGGQYQTCNRGSVVQGQPSHLGGINNTHFQQIAVFARGSVVAEVARLRNGGLLAMTRPHGPGRFSSFG